MYRSIMLLMLAFVLLIAALVGREVSGTGNEQREPELALLDRDGWDQLAQQKQDWLDTRSTEPECLLLWQDESASMAGDQRLRVLSGGFSRPAGHRK